MNTRTTMVQQYAKMQKIGCCTDCVNDTKRVTDVQRIRCQKRIQYKKEQTGEKKPSISLLNSDFKTFYTNII